MRLFIMLIARNAAEINLIRVLPTTQRRDLSRLVAFKHLPKIVLSISLCFVGVVSAGFAPAILRGVRFPRRPGSRVRIIFR